MRSSRHVIAFMTLGLNISLLCSKGAYGAETITADRSDAVKSLTQTLEQAVEDGLLRTEDSQSSQRDTTPSLSSEDILKANPQSNITRNCQVAKILDLSKYKSVTTYEDIQSAKSQITNSEESEALWHLAKTYLALGLGTEAQHLVNNFDDEKSRLLGAIGRYISDDMTGDDIRLVKQYSECDETTALWTSLTALANNTYQNSLTVPPANSHRKLVEDLPKRLQQLIELRFAIAAEENGNLTEATRLLEKIAPEVRNGDVPQHNDDSVMYLFGTLLKSKNDDAAIQVFEHLSKSDGLFRLKALRQMTELSAGTPEMKQVNLDIDLASISQQYHGQVESNQAKFQMIESLLLSNRATDALTLTRESFAETQTEFSAAQKLLGDSIFEKLGAESRSENLSGLNNYFYAPDFFSGYANYSALKMRVKNSAIDLNLPELVKHIQHENKDDMLTAVSEVAFSEALAAAKAGDHKAVLNLPEIHADNQNLQNLSYQSAIWSGDLIHAKSLLNSDISSTDKLRRKITLDWLSQDWAEAENALRTLTKENPEIDFKDELSFTEFVNSDHQPNTSKSLTTISGFQGFGQQIAQDIQFIKGYLENG